ncbi:MAG: hypothetical protein ABI980_07045 [Nitrospirota bacterium]
MRAIARQSLPRTGMKFIVMLENGFGDMICHGMKTKTFIHLIV